MTNSTAPATSPAAESVPYFFLLRLQWSVGGGLAASVFHGTHSVRPGESRHQIFTELRDLALQKVGAPANADITAFILEPDRFAGPARFWRPTTGGSTPGCRRTRAISPRTSLPRRVPAVP